MVAGLIQSQNNIRFRNELMIEAVRLKHFAARTSRLSGMYFFESYKDARKAIEQRWRGHFCEENLFELELYPEGDVTRVDANWITCAPLINGVADATAAQSWVNSYWGGVSHPDHEPVWELISEGVAIVTDVELRKRSYEYVKRQFPKAWISIEMARLAGEAGSDGGLIAPFLLQHSPGKWELVYIGYEKDFKEPDVIAKMRDHPDFPRLLAEVEKNETFPSADFTPWYKKFEFGLDTVEEGVLSVHHSN